MPENEPSNMSQKQNLESGKTASKSNEASTTIKESYNLQPGQISDDSHDLSKSHEEERNLSCKNEKDSDMLLQEPTSNPPLASHPMRDEKALEKVQLVRNMDAVDYRSQSNQGITASTILKDFTRIPKDEPGNLHLRQSCDSGAQTPGTCGGERTSVKRERVSDVLLPVQSVKAAPASQSDRPKLIYSTRPENAVEKLQPRRNPDTGGCNSHSYKVVTPSSVSDPFSIITKEESQSNNIQPKQILDARNHDALLRKDGSCAAEKREMVSDNLVQVSSLSSGVPVPQTDQEKFTYSTKFEKVEKLQPRRNPDPVVQGLQSDGRSTLSKVLEKGLHDGYNWRKYGQKLVKGNKFIRSYYKCTSPNCQAKKQVERSCDGSYDGCKTDVNYLGMHHHEKPQQGSQVTSAFQLQTPETPIASAKRTDPEPIIDHGVANLCMVPAETSDQSIVPRSADDVTGVVPSSINDNNTNKNDDPDSKRQKREATSVDNNVVNKPHSDLRHVVQTLSEVDIVNDGYRWRKYGQKLVKGNPNPRSYYRCSNAGCPAKKHVERASHDPKVVITTYEGQHDHEMPPSRPVSQTTARDDANMITTNGDSRPKPDENSPVSLEMVVHVTAN